ncbi:hypothetical protein JKP88DRAFT_283402 [Tribonema minus]|uniref:Guanylate cyclase domain-containing protein n=1 Tax=Tribonema minus TaxID=303371 RepID=A0A835YIG6_9STRA|nr:hypothetical protein JKP88DRAFT_283402 [Tribonema minus]
MDAKPDFGDADADIIARNLRKSSNNRLNLLTSGTMARAVFGFCDIRAFTDTTECLREEVMPFVNRVARLLHAVARRYGGSAGGSAGDAFLLTWPATICGDRGRNGGGSGGSIGGSNSSGGAGRGGGGAGGTGGAGGSSGSSSASLSAGASSSGGGGGGGGSGRGAESVATAADHALLSFLRVIVEMERQQDYICQFSVSAMSRVCQRMPDYKARMGFGLHVGWAVQGAIGSDKKIDTSFMSPHVGLVEFLEACTKTYGVPLLMSKAFYQQLSANAQAQCRLVDVVQRAPHDPPLHIYAYACDFFKRVTPASDTSELQPFDSGGSSQRQQQQPPASAPLNITLPRLTVLVNFGGGGGAMDLGAQKERVGQYLRLRRASSMNGCVGQYLRLRRASSMNVVNPSLAWSETVMSGALNRPSVTHHLRNSVVGEVAPFDLGVQRTRTPSPRDTSHDLSISAPDTPLIPPVGEVGEVAPFDLDVQRPRTPTPRDADNYGPAVCNPSISADTAGRVMSEAMTVPPAIEFRRQPSVDLGPPPQRSFVFSLPPPERSSVLSLPPPELGPLRRSFVFSLPPPERSFVFSLPPPEMSFVFSLLPPEPSSWLSDPDLRWIRGEHTPETRAQWAAVMAAYVRGDWAAALPLAHAFDARFGGRDGPCTHLLRVLRAGRPRDWAGHRLLYAWLRDWAGHRLLYAW